MNLKLGLLRCFLWGAVALLGAACSVNPVTGQKEVSLMSASQEVATGVKNYTPYQQQQGGRYVVDPELGFYVSEVGKRLAAASDRPQLPYEFVVLNSSVPNAWALPGGKIAVNRGLLTLLDDESQLAAVLSHEIVHAAARHSARQMTQATLMQVGMMAAGIASQNSDYGQWIMAGAGLGANAWQARYGRDQELEADSYGVKYMLKAGYDPQGAVELQKKFVELSKGQQGGFMQNLFASHPPSSQRVERNKKLAAGRSGNRNQGVFKRALSQLTQDAAAYDLHSQALVASSKGSYQEAKSLIAQAIKKQPKEALFHIAKGQLLLAESSQTAHAEALSAFNQAAALNPEYYLGHLGSGLVLYEQKQKASASAALQKSMRLLPTPMASYYLGEYAIEAGNQAQAREYFQFASQGEGKIAEMAQAQLSKLAPPASSN